MKKSVENAVKNSIDWMVLGLLPLVFWLPTLVKNLAFVYRDSFNIFYPFRIYAARLISQGDIPFWAPEVGGGTPFFANPQNALFYPPQILLYLFPSNLGLNLEIIFHFSWAAWGMYALCRWFGLSRMAGVFTGLCFTFGPLMVVSIEYLPLFCALAWLPWCFWGWLTLWLEPSCKTAARFALIWACGVLAGMLDVMVMAGVCSLILIFCYRLPSKNNVRRGLFLLIASLLTLSLTAFQWVPFFHELKLSNRQSGEFSRGILYWSLHPLEVLGVAFPMFFGGISCKWFGQLWLQGFYLGVFPTALLMFLPIRLRMVRVLLCVALLFFVFALGQYAPGVSYFLEHVPLFSRIRFPSKYFVVTLFFLTLSMGFAFDHWRQSSAKRKKLLPLAVLGWAVFGFLFVWQIPWAMQWFGAQFPETFVPAAATIWGESLSDALWVQGSLLALSLVFLLMTLHARFQSWLGLAIVVFVIAELTLYLPFFVVRAPARFLEEPARNITLLPQEKMRTRIIRFDQYAPANNWYHFGRDYLSRLKVAKEGLSPMLPILHGVNFASIYQGLEPLSYARAYRALDYDLKLKNHTDKPLEVVREWGISHGISSVPIDHPQLHLLSREPFFLYEVFPKPEFCFLKMERARRNLAIFIGPMEIKCRWSVHKVFRQKEVGWSYASVTTRIGTSK